MLVVPSSSGLRTSKHALCYRSGRNIEKLKLNEASGLNTYDILRADKILMDKASLNFVNQWYGKTAANDQ